jgi:CHAT domain-containing protein
MLAQGAGSVLGTLWKVPDRATALFMEYFYASLAVTNNSSLALQLAKQKMKQNPRFRAQRYWGAFVLTVARKNAETIQF